MEVNKIFHKSEDMFSRSWNAEGVGTFVKGVQDDVSGKLRYGWRHEHVFEALHQGRFTGLSFARVKGRIEAGEYVETWLGPRRKLY